MAKQIYGTLFGIYLADVNSCIRNINQEVMKRLVNYFAIILLGITYMQAEVGKSSPMSYYNYGKSFIFVEDGITFSVYPDGEFDFYINNRVAVGAQVNVGYSSITFNSGFNYNPFVQYDDYGAVIQVENVPIFYDFYGRVSQIGNINVWYRNGMVRRIGGLRIYYNNLGYFDYYTGYINGFNRFYVYRPYHRFFIRPAVGFCQVFTRPYRRYYHPVRYTYYAPYRYNHRRVYATVGRPYRHYDRGYHRDRIYRNDRRVAVRDNGRRNEYGHVRGNDRIVRNSADQRTRTVNRSTQGRINEGSRNGQRRISESTRSTQRRNSDATRSNTTRTRVARSSDNEGRRVSRNIQSRERQVGQSNARRSNSSTNARTQKARVESRRSVTTPREKSVTRSHDRSRKLKSDQPRSRTYERKVTSSRKVTAKPSNRTSRSSSVARSSSSKRGDGRSYNRSSSRSRTSEAPKRSSRVRRK